MDNKEILQIIKKKIKKARIKSVLRFPRKLCLDMKDGVVTITINKESVQENMQKDDSAFEGWVLCIKAAMDDDKICWKFVLDWGEPQCLNNIDRQHYQRFLYRANKFDEIFGGDGGWFSIKDKRRLTALKIQYDINRRYCLNTSSTEDDKRLSELKKNTESALENYIIKNQKRLSSFKKICSAKLKRQLPVGVFKDSVSAKNTILPGKKSAIDIWGVNKDVLYIFELKDENNVKVGVLSEMFFYAMIISDEQNKKIWRDSTEGEEVRATDRIVAHLLTPRLHPFITEKVFNLINAAFNKKHKNITFGHIRFSIVDGRVINNFSLCN